MSFEVIFNSARPETLSESADYYDGFCQFPAKKLKALYGVLKVAAS
jgi:hypothetical protein